MSASLSWSPISPQPIQGAGQGETAMRLRKQFGDFPIQLSMNDMDTLHTMALMDGRANEENPFVQLQDALLIHETVLVEVSY